MTSSFLVPMWIVYANGNPHTPLLRAAVRFATFVSATIAIVGCKASAETLAIPPIKTSRRDAD